MERVNDGDLWSFRASQRHALIRYARHRLVRQMQMRGAARDLIQQAGHVLDPNAITLGYARRFAEYKRPNLLLHDADRLARLLCHPERPVQLIVAGKAHPQDEEGKHVVHAFTRFAARADVWDRVVFLEDYDIALAQHLVSGIDVWLNTPERPQEASGTSGMKAALNGVPSLSVLDGWWIEGHQEGVTGWAIGDGQESTDDPSQEVASLYDQLEHVILPLFYKQPTEFAKVMRSAIAFNGAFFNTQRMVFQYLRNAYFGSDG